MRPSARQSSRQLQSALPPAWFPSAGPAASCPESLGQRSTSRPPPGPPPGPRPRRARGCSWPRPLLPAARHRPVAAATAYQSRPACPTSLSLARRTTRCCAGPSALELGAVASWTDRGSVPCANASPPAWRGHGAHTLLPSEGRCLAVRRAAAGAPGTSKPTGLAEKTRGTRASRPPRRQRSPMRRGGRGAAVGHRPWPRARCAATRAREGVILVTW